MTVRQHSMWRFSAILISRALASKVLGFAREVMMAHVLGATLVADGFRAAMAVGLLMSTAALSALNRLRRTFRVKGELG